MRVEYIALCLVFREFLLNVFYFGYCVWDREKVIRRLLKKKKKFENLRSIGILKMIYSSGKVVILEISGF